MDNLLERFEKIKVFLFDVDGVLTDGTLLITEKGELLRRMNAKDGSAMRHALDQGYHLEIISGGNSKGVEERLRKLGIMDVHMSIHDKVDKLEELLLIYEWKPEEILFMGDDYNDIGILKQVGLPCCPANAIPEVKEIADYVSPIDGGGGCVRDVIEKVLKSNGHWLTDIL